MSKKIQPEPKPEPDDELFPDGFIGFRAGIKEHIAGGRFQGYDLAVYFFLHAFATFRAGICFTNAVTISNALGIPTRSVNDSMTRLRDRGYINYPKGNGQRGSYFIAIHKYRPTAGVLRGYDLDAFTHKDLEYFAYTKPNSARVLTALRPRADHAETALMPLGDRVLTACIEDSKDSKAGVKGVAGVAGNVLPKRVSELVSEAGADAPLNMNGECVAGEHWLSECSQFLSNSTPCARCRYCTVHGNEYVPDCRGCEVLELSAYEEEPESEPIARQAFEVEEDIS